LKRIYEHIPLLGIIFLLISTIFYFFLPEHGKAFAYTYGEFLKVGEAYKILFSLFLNLKDVQFVLNSIVIFLTLYYVEVEIGRKKFLQFFPIYYLGVWVTSLFFKDFIFTSTSFLFYLFGFSLFLFPLKRPIEVPIVMKFGYKEKLLRFKSRRFDPRSILIYSLILFYICSLLTLIFLGIITSDEIYVPLSPLFICFFFGAFANSLFDQRSRRIVLSYLKLFSFAILFFSFIIVLFYLMNLGLGTEEIPRKLEGFFSTILNFFLKP